MNMPENENELGCLIPLSRGMVSVIDRDDAFWVTKWKWSVRLNNREIPYACRGVSTNGVQHCVHLHRAIYERHKGAVPFGLEIDHINRNTLDNRLCNLRAVTRSVNNANRGPCRNRKHDLPKGVYPNPDGRFRAQITIRSKTVYLGLFLAPEDAHAAFEEVWRRTYANQ